jgi:hypothetical protein
MYTFEDMLVQTFLFTLVYYLVYNAIIDFLNKNNESEVMIQAIREKSSGRVPDVRQETRLMFIPSIIVSTVVLVIAMIVF